MIRPGTAAIVPVAAVAVGVFAGGGYSPGARVAFGVVSFLALAGLAALGALSALWTLGPVDRTLRWALVCLGYAAVAVAANVAARRAGPEALGLGLAVLAGVAGLAGLVAAAAFEPPYAERIAGVWRPGGPFEYAPALALLEVSALPPLLYAMAGRSRVLAGAAAIGMAIAGGVIALSASRVSLALAVGMAGLALLAAGTRRAQVGGALCLAVGAGVALEVAAPVRGAVLIAVVVLAGPLWLAVRGALARRPAHPFGVPVRWVVPAVVVASVLAGGLAFGAAAGRGVGAAGGFLHGRESTWRAAIETFADRPFSGAGADAFLAGSARHQGGQTIAFAHSLPLELAAELGIAGLLLAIALYAASARGLWRARHTEAVWLLGPAAAGFLIASLVDWPWHLAGAGAVWALAIGALAGTTAGPTGGSSRVRLLPKQLHKGDR
jgi:hypothetical protein